MGDVFCAVEPDPDQAELADAAVGSDDGWTVRGKRLLPPVFDELVTDPTTVEFENPTGHPATYSVELMPSLTRWFRPGALVLDPMAGPEGVRRLGLFRPDVSFVGVERQEAWARRGLETVHGDAGELPFADGAFDAGCSTPTYANRIADRYLGERCRACGGQGRVLVNVRRRRCVDCDGTGRRSTVRGTYTLAHVALTGEPLAAGNAGGWNWGTDYRSAHADRFWPEMFRVLRSGGVFVLNVSDHIRGTQPPPKSHPARWYERFEFPAQPATEHRKAIPAKPANRVRVTRWHVDVLCGIGFELVAARRVSTPSARNGANHERRTDGEFVLVFVKP